MDKYEFDPFTIPILIGLCLIPIVLVLRVAINSYFSFNISYYEVLIPIGISVPILVYLGGSKK